MSENTILVADDESVLDAAEFTLGEEYQDYPPHELAHMEVVQEELKAAGFHRIGPFHNLSIPIYLT